MSKQRPKNNKPGRPRLAKADAKGKIVPVRSSPEGRKRAEAAAQASRKTVSERIRCTLAAALEA